MSFLDKKSESLAQQKKLELKDELTKELATKTDLILVKTELEAKIDKEALKLQMIYKSLIKSLQLCLSS